MTQILELADKDIKTTILTSFQEVKQRHEKY